MTLNKYAAALFHFALAVLAALATAFKAGPLTPTIIGQLVVFAIGTFVVWWVPLLNTRWQGLLKVIAAGAVAAVTAIVPLIVAHSFTLQDATVVVYAILGAVAAGLGVALRTDGKPAD
ncbi:MAG: hypothetical protein ABJB03_00585 [Rhodoglobus sp.]